MPLWKKRKDIRIQIDWDVFTSMSIIDLFSVEEKHISFSLVPRLYCANVDDCNKHIITIIRENSALVIMT